MSVKITVPATSANLGIGYDCLGMAVSLYSEFTFERADELQISGCPEKYRNEKNLVYRSFELALAHWGEEPFPIKLHIDAAIPVSRGWLLIDVHGCGHHGCAALTVALWAAQRREHRDRNGRATPITSLPPLWGRSCVRLRRRANCRIAFAIT